MLPYSAAAVYTNQLQQAAALSYHHHQQQQHQNQGPPSPATSLQLAASLNFERLRYGFAAVQSPNGVMVPTGPGAGGGVVGPNQAQGGSPVAGGYPPAVFQHAAAAAAAAAFDPMTLAAAGFRHAFDPRTGRFLPPEEPKPQHSYIGLIAMAILSNSEKKMVLSDIYQWILDHYPYFRTRGPGWRNSIRHNLSLNDCFIKAGRSANGKGHYWAIHPANVEDFKKGDFRRRRAQRKVRKHMGLAVPDDEEDSDDSPCSSPPVSGGNFFLTPNGNLPPPTAGAVLASLPAVHAAVPQNLAASKVSSTFLIDGRNERDRAGSDEEVKAEKSQRPDQPQAPKRKRLFDMESLLSSRTDEKRAATGSVDSSAAGQRSGGEENVGDGAGVNEKASNLLISDPRQQILGSVPNPFFFPPPLPPSGAGPENGHFLAAMAAAAAGFMPFAFLPGPGAPTPGLAWNFGCAPPTSSAASALSSFLPISHPQTASAQSMGGNFFWQHGVPKAASISPPRPGSKTASNTPPGIGNVENGTNGDTPMQQAAPGHDGHGGGRSTTVSVTRSPSPQDTAAQWQETFAKIMARSYQGRNLMKSSSLCLSKGPCHSSDAEEDEQEEKLSKSPKPVQANC